MAFIALNPSEPRPEEKCDVWDFFHCDNKIHKHNTDIKLKKYFSEETMFSYFAGAYITDFYKFKKIDNNHVLFEKTYSTKLKPTKQEIELNIAILLKELNLLNDVQPVFIVPLGEKTRKELEINQECLRLSKKTY